jgi:hypothetical protein
MLRFKIANLNHPGPGSFVDRDMVMRHFGGGIGHLQSTHHFLRGEQVVSETASIGNSEDEDNTEDLGGSDATTESGTVSSSSAEDSESELDPDSNGYDSL